MDTELCFIAAKRWGRSLDRKWVNTEPRHFILFTFRFECTGSFRSSVRKLADRFVPSLRFYSCTAPETYMYLNVSPSFRYYHSIVFLHAGSLCRASVASHNPVFITLSRPIFCWESLTSRPRLV